MKNYAEKENVPQCRLNQAPPRLMVENHVVGMNLVFFVVEGFGPKVTKSKTSPRSLIQLRLLLFLSGYIP